MPYAPCRSNAPNISLGLANDAALMELSAKLHLSSASGGPSRALQVPLSGLKPVPAIGQSVLVPLLLPSQVTKAWQLSGATTLALAGLPAQTQPQPGQLSG